MALASIDSDDLTATAGGTEDVLSTQTDPGTYVLGVDMANLANGDTVILKIKTKIKTGAISRIAYEESFSNVQADPNKYSIPVAIDTEIVCTLTQTAGTARVFPWNLLAG
jgi:hypothetical protein